MHEAQKPDRGLACPFKDQGDCRAHLDQWQQITCPQQPGAGMVHACETFKENIVPYIMDKITAAFAESAKKIDPNKDDLPALLSFVFVSNKNISAKHANELVLPWLPPVLVEHAGKYL